MRSLDDSWEVFANDRTGVITILPPFVGCAGSRLLGISDTREAAEQFALQVATDKGYVVSDPWKETVQCPESTPR